MIKKLKMNKNNNLYKWIIGFLVVYIIFLLSFPNCKSDEIIIKKTDTITVSDTIIKTDTFLVEKPIPKYIEIVKIDTVFNEKGDTIQLVTENKQYNDTICYQNDSIILESSISGINPTLDYIKAELRKQEIVNTVEITKFIKEKPKKWSFGTSIGYGLGLKNRDFEPFLGITLQYRF